MAAARRVAVAVAVAALLAMVLLRGRDRRTPLTAYETKKKKKKSKKKGRGKKGNEERTAALHKQPDYQKKEQKKRDACKDGQWWSLSRQRCMSSASCSARGGRVTSKTCLGTTKEDDNNDSQTYRATDRYVAGGRSVNGDGRYVPSFGHDGIANSVGRGSTVAGGQTVAIDPPR